MMMIRFSKQKKKYKMTDQASTSGYKSHKVFNN